MSTNVMRVTKNEKFQAIVKALEAMRDGEAFEPIVIAGTPKADGTPREGVTIDEDMLIEFCNSEIAALSRKNTSERPQTAQQKENETAKALMISYLTAEQENADEDYIGKTCTELNREITELQGFSNQRLARLLGILRNDGQVKRTVVKGVTYFTVA